mmetsp:Transcript_14966/g.41385  ORF Transcript_14966/g.41385 Transcript_14966/m.41385 type:complete len:162 (-) Transcript_14966:89-574(-)
MIDDVVRRERDEKNIALSNMEGVNIYGNTFRLSRIKCMASFKRVHTHACVKWSSNLIVVSWLMLLFLAERGKDKRASVYRRVNIETIQWKNGGTVLEWNVGSSSLANDVVEAVTSGCIKATTTTTTTIRIFVWHWRGADGRNCLLAAPVAIPNRPPDARGH